MSTVAITPSVNSSSDRGFSQVSEVSTRTERATPLVWGERSACRTQDIVRPGQHARVSGRGNNVGSMRRPRSDSSRPSRGTVNYGRPALSISRAQQPFRRDISAGANLTRLMSVWALGIGVFFGIFGTMIFEQGQSEAFEATFTPTYASYSAQ